MHMQTEAHMGLEQKLNRHELLLVMLCNFSNFHLPLQLPKTPENLKKIMSQWVAVQGAITENSAFTLVLAEALSDQATAVLEPTHGAAFSTESESNPGH